MSTLEDVVKAIKADTSGQWKQALFIPPGSAQIESSEDEELSINGGRQ